MIKVYITESLQEVKKNFDESNKLESCVLGPSVLSTTTCSLKIESAEYLSVRDLAQLLGVSEKTVRGWVYKKLIQPEKIGPRLIRFKGTYIEQWISQRK